jgi:hypothetical protein
MLQYFNSIKIIIDFEIKTIVLHIKVLSLILGESFEIQFSAIDLKGDLVDGEINNLLVFKIKGFNSILVKNLKNQALAIL